MNKKSKRIVIVLFLILLALAGLSYSFVIKSTTNSNIIKFGSLKLKLIETTLVDGEEKEVNDGYEDVLKPVASRMVRVKNVGKHPMYLRFSLNTYVITNDEKTSLGNLVSYDVNETDYIYKDGWYYYKKVLLPNETTENLITKIIFDVDNIKQQYENGRLNFDVDVGAVQSENNADNVLEVEGWPVD